MSSEAKMHRLIWSGSTLFNNSIQWWDKRKPSGKDTMS